MKTKVLNSLKQIMKINNFNEIIGKVKTAFSLKSTRLGIVLSLVLSLSFFLVPVLPLLFIRELGWSQEQFNAQKAV